MSGPEHDATWPAPPSAAGATLTREPVGEAEAAAFLATGPRLAAPAQVRDRERYVILGEHGRGGLGRVSRAHDRELGRDVAIKELIARSQINEARFLREALITARLEHPGIVTVHEAGRWPDGTAFYAMKLVAGRPLRELIAERTSIEDRIDLLHHVIAVADAIAYAHGRNIIHRDLKPANVIVGEFGETIVIDWGLAKDLTEAEQSVIASGVFRASPDDGLTTTGSVLGTPAYMAPEQERGERVDQRADVFAIGAMLWELCAVPRVPPVQADRHRVLRRAGIDDDLATIIDKALDPEPARRYPDAGALATDLKAFKSGTRIAARRYSPFAVLAHWVRRHRALALSVTAVTMLAAAGAAVFVRNIAVERDRAEAANNDRILEHAELLLHGDPTAAVAALSEYRGDDALRRRRLLAEAEGRGVARAVYAPHADTVWLAVGDETGAIVSVGEDRRIQLTRGATSTTLAADVSTVVRVAYAPAAQLIAYATSPPGIATLDLRTRALRRLATFDPVMIELAPDGSRLAALGNHGELTVWSTGADATQIVREVIPGALWLVFATPTRLIVQLRTGLRAVALDPVGGAPDHVAIADVTAFDARPDIVIAGTASGDVVVLAPGLEVLGRTSMCHQRLRDVRLIAHTDRLAFSCQEGVTGIARVDPARHQLTVVDIFGARGLTWIAADLSGRYVVVMDESSTAYVYDTETRLLTHYDGNAGHPSSVTVPTPAFDHVLVGDANGTVRVWDPPTRSSRVVLQAQAPVLGLAFSHDGKALFTGGVDQLVRRITLDGGEVTALAGDISTGLAVHPSPDGSSVLSFSYEGAIRVWRASDSTLIRTFVEHGSVVHDVGYVQGGYRIVSVGDDGRLLAWSPAGTDVSVLFSHTAPLTALEVLARNDHVAVADAKGALWDVALDGRTQKIRGADGAALTMLRASPDGNYVATGNDAGVVTVYETASYHIVKTIQIPGGVRQIAFDPLGRDLLVASEAGHAQFGHVQLVALGMQRAVGWHDIVAAVRDVAYAPDGDTIGFVCADGGTWLYGAARDSWAYTRDHDIGAMNGRFSPDGRLFASSDRRGVVVVRDVASTFATAVN